MPPNRIALLALAALQAITLVASAGSETCAAGSTSKQCLDSDGDGVVDSKDSAPNNPDIDGKLNTLGTPLLMQPIAVVFWPPGQDKIVLYVVSTIVLYLALAFIVRQKETSADKRKRAERFHQVLANLAQITHENEDVLKERKEVDDKKEKLKAEAQRRAKAKPEMTEEQYFNLLARETNFWDLKKPELISPLRALEVLVDEIEGCSVNHIPGIGKTFDAEEKKQFDQFYVDAVALMHARFGDNVKEVMKKTAEARGQIFDAATLTVSGSVTLSTNPHDLPYSTGTKLEELIILLSKVRATFIV